MPKNGLKKMNEENGLQVKLKKLKNEEKNFLIFFVLFINYKC